MTYAIRFDFPELNKPLYAGLHKGAYGWAPTLGSASLFETEDEAFGVLGSAYGPNIGKWGKVVVVKDSAE